MKIEYMNTKSPKICKKCLGEFPNWIKIDGKLRNTCGRVYCPNCSPIKKGLKNSARLAHYKTINNIVHKQCRDCEIWKPKHTEFYHIKSKDGLYPKPYCKNCQSIKRYNQLEKAKMKAVVFKGNRCQDCHKQFKHFAYDFHHRNPDKKDFDLSSGRLMHKTWQALKIELDKCDLLCAICHRDRHFNRDNPNYMPLPHKL